MKYFLSLIALILTVSTTAQTVTRPKLDKNSVVKDVEGNTLPYAIWSKLGQTGEYGIRLVEGNEFLIYRYTPEQAKRNAEMKQASIARMGKPRPSDVFKEGEKFKGERFTSIEKVKFDMKQNPDKIYVLNFWFINCPPCKQEIPELNDMVARYKDHPEVVFIGVALDGSYDLKKFLKTNPFNYHIVADGRFYSEKYGVKSYPTHVIVGKDGLIKFSTVGLAPNTVHWIDNVIKEQITPASTIGASD